MHQEFRAREVVQNNARSFKRTMVLGDMGYSASKQCTEEKRQAAYSSSGAQPFEKVLQATDNEKVYDTESNDEADKLEIDIERERNDQKWWKHHHRVQTEKWEKWKVVSRQERNEVYKQLANCLMHSERVTWVEPMEKLD